MLACAGHLLQGSETFRELLHPDLWLCWLSCVALHVPIHVLRSGCRSGDRWSVQANTFCQDHCTSLSCTLAISSISRLFLWGCYHLHLSSRWFVMHPEFSSQFPDSLISLLWVAKLILLYLVAFFIKVLLLGLATHRFDLLTDVWGISVTHFPLSSQFHLTESFFCHPWFVLRMFSVWQLVFRFIHSSLHRSKVFPIFSWIKESGFEFSANFWVTLLPIYPLHVFCLLSLKLESKPEMIVCSTTTITYPKQYDGQDKTSNSMSLQSVVFQFTHSTKEKTLNDEIKKFFKIASHPG